MKPRIDWKRVWDEFSVWWHAEVDKRKVCTTCGHRQNSDPEWPEQEKIIQRIVDRQLKTKRK